MKFGASNERNKPSKRITLRCCGLYLRVGRDQCFSTLQPDGLRKEMLIRPIFMHTWSLVEGGMCFIPCRLVIGGFKRVASVRGEVIRYLTQQFSWEEWERPNLDGVEFPRFGTSDNDFLIALFFVQETERVSLACDGNKSPGPDGFNFAFNKALWPLL